VNGFDYGKWADFLAGGELDDVSVFKYYLGDKGGAARTRENMPVEDLEKLATELFADVVAIGAVELPDGYSADDFEFKIVPNEFAQKSRWKRTEVRLKKHPQLLNGTEFTEFTYYLDPIMNMKNMNVSSMIGQMNSGVRSLIQMDIAENGLV
jgi:hypothetical protein